MTARQIAIDGPAGAGKSTVAKGVAQKLGYLYIDTGAMYRAIAYLALRQGVALDDEAALAALATRAKIVLASQGEQTRVYVDGEEVSLQIREPAVGAAASPVSAVLGVREALVKQQQALAASEAVVMDGRDIGTHVLPDADCKIFLTASLEERVRRRAKEWRERGVEISDEQVRAEMAERDYRDSHREHSPLRQAEDAVLIDSSTMTADEVIATSCALANSAKG